MFNTAKAATASIPPNASQLQSLLGAGVTLAESLITGTGQGAQAARTLLQGAQSIAAGAAVGGPWGAAIGAVITAGQLISESFEGYQGVVLEPSRAATSLYSLRQQWVQAGNTGRLTQRAQGASLWDYLVFKYPVGTTKRASTLYTMIVQSCQDLITTVEALDLAFTAYGKYSSQTGINAILATAAAFQAGQWGWNSIKNGSVQNNSYPSSAMKNGTLTADGFAGYCGPLCSSAAFEWGFPDQIAGCVQNEYLSPIPPLSQLAQLWQSDTEPVNSNGQVLSIAQIQAQALARRPDPMYFCADLYAFQDTYGTNSTILYNLEALVMLTTWLGMLAIGASTRAILSELLFQQSAIYQQNNHVVPYVCRQMVEDVIALAKSETVSAKTPLKTTIAPATPSASDPASAPAFGASGATPSFGAALAAMAKKGQSSGPSTGAVAAGALGVGLAGLAAYKYLL
jgi:hypothetical protein